MKTCKEHGWEWTDGDPGCPFCLRNERDRYKAALEAIATAQDGGYIMNNVYQMIAREALTPSPEKVKE